jgi:integrative and conjugative element protein (TIGR02256 family)
VTLRFVEHLGGPAIVLTKSALSTINRYQQVASRDKEAGGQLFAKFEGADTVIIEATHPKWLDRRTRYGFRPNRWLQQLEIRDRHTKGLHFVGDWHTHPESVPNPSREDIFNMIECFNLSHHDLQAFVMVVIGIEPVPKGLYVALVQGETVAHLILDT